MIAMYKTPTEPFVVPALGHSNLPRIVISDFNIHSTTWWYSTDGRSIINYAAPVWSPNLHDTNYRKIQYTQNEALRIATECHKMSSIDHLHTEMLKVREHCLHSTWPDVWNQEMYVIPSQQGPSLRDRWRRRYTPDIETL